MGPNIHLFYIRVVASGRNTRIRPELYNRRRFGRGRFAELTYSLRLSKEWWYDLN